MASFLDLVNNSVAVVGQQVMARAYGGLQVGVNTPEALRLRDQVLTQYPFTPEARKWLCDNVGVALKDGTSQRGGGYWFGWNKLVFLYTGQLEAALHEHSHAWWEFHGHRLPVADEIIATLSLLADEKDPAYARTQALAHDYVYGIHTPDRDWEGMVVTRNDHEIFAGLASGTMGDMALLPPYMRRFYQGLFVMPA